MKEVDTLPFEVSQLLEAVYFRYGYDFRHYARESIERRIVYRVEHSELDNVSQMIGKVMHDPDYFNLFLNDMSVTVTEMFRDPLVFKKIRNQLLLQLKTYSRINIWHAGCSTGEEVYAMAIMLEEEGLLERCQLYATDFNNHSLAVAKEGIYSLQHMSKYQKSYKKSGGTKKLADYYHTKHEHIKFDQGLRQHITFANHNLVKDREFAQMHLVMCRNVLIYFDHKLQQLALNLFKSSLVNRGYLILGREETLGSANMHVAFESIDAKYRIYRCVANV
ncbi:MAG: protein-glutamate O-methyltransferase CheR [Pseudomonadales bacterium]|nr:protein-glutamate O-methyltransferase CheR [Pseudomonadales bacterium]NRA15401.1 protein-glutamate O-methyltransferase CheR [Oceanospirillaceae bacterium]